MSSTIFAVCGNSSDTHAPLWPCCVKARRVPRSVVPWLESMNANYPQRLPDLEPRRASCLLDGQPAGRPLGEGIAHLPPPSPGHAAEDAESLRRLRLEELEVGVEDVLTPAPVQVHEVHDPRLVEAFQQLFEWSFLPAPAEGLGQVIVGLDHGEARLRDVRRLDHQLRARALALEQHSSSSQSITPAATRTARVESADRRATTSADISLSIGENTSGPTPFRPPLSARMRTSSTFGNWPSPGKRRS